MAGVVSTLAGTGVIGHSDGPGAQAQFNSPFGVAVDGEGNVYVGDQSNHRIRKVAPDGTVSTLAGTGAAGHSDSPGAQAQFNCPRGVVVDGEGNVYVADYYNHRIRKLVGFAVAGAMLPAAAAGPGRPFTVRLAALERRVIAAATAADRTTAVHTAAVAEAEAALEQAQAAQAAAVREARDRHAAACAALAEVEAEADGFRSRVAREGLAGLDELGAYEVLQLLGVAGVTLGTLRAQEIGGAVLPDLTEADMQGVLGLTRLGDRRRLAVALRRLAQGQGFPPPATARHQQPGALAWDVAQAAQWLVEEGFGELAAVFTAQAVDGECLLLLRAEDLAGLGVATVGQRSRLTRQLEALTKLTYAGQVVRGQGKGVAGGAVLPVAEVLAAVLEENEELQQRMAELRAEAAADRAVDVPPQFFCPILQDLMQDPVMAMDGHTYERAAITTWFRRSARSPMTNLEIPPTLVPNHAIRQQIAALASPKRRPPAVGGGSRY